MTAKRKPKVTLQHYDGVCRTPALKLAVEGWNALLQAGLVEEVALIGWDNKAFVAFIGKDPIGVLTYSSQADYAKQYHVNIGYVLPAHRRKGVYAKMWEALVKKAREAGIKNIESATAMENKAMRAQAKKMGRTERGVLLTYRL